MNNELQLSDYLSAIDQKFDRITSILEHQNNIVANVAKKVSRLDFDLSDLKERVYKDEIPSLSTCSWGKFSGVGEAQLDIDERNFDKAWFLKHYKVDCPEFDQPLSMESLHNLGCDMTPEQYGKYVVTFDNLDDRKVEAL